VGSMTMSARDKALAAVIVTLCFLAFTTAFSVVVQAQTLGFLKGWYADGNFTVCEYQTQRGTYMVLIDAAEVCEDTIEIPNTETV